MASVVGLPNLTEKEAIDIDVPRDRASEPKDPWIANMGIFQDDPTFDDFLTEVNTYRNAINYKE